MIDEYYAYITLREKFIPIKLDCNEVINKLMNMTIGDFLLIKGLGKLQVVNHYSRADNYNDTMFHEIGITCNQVRG